MNEIPAKGLTTENIKALRNADWVRFRWDGTTTKADAHKSTTRDGFPDEVEVDIPVLDSKFTVYERNGDSGRTDPTSAVGVISTARYHELWQSVARILRKGDRLQPHFIANNTTENLRDAGLTHDEFRLMVLRGPIDKLVVMSFWLEDEITPPNSRARSMRFS